MKRILYPLIIAAAFIAGCGDSFNSAQDNLTGPVNGIGLKPSTSLVSGGSEKLYPVVSPPKTENKGVTWTSSDSSKVSVDSSGVITGVAAPAHGTTETAVITATTVEGGYTAECTVTVSEKPVAITGVTISQTTMTLHAGNQGQLTATVTPSDATNQNLTWTSSSSGKVAVDTSGLVTAVAAGTAIITVTTVDGGYKASCVVTSTTDTVYSVTYFPNTATGGAVPLDLNSYLSGTKVTVMGRNTLVKDSYSFAGWNTLPGGAGTPYSVGSTFNMGNTSVSLYAMWTADLTYTVTYDGNSSTGGNVPTDSNHYLPGAAVTILGNTGGLYRTGYSFGGWYINSSSTYNDGDIFSPMPGGNVTMLAKWIPVYKVTYYGNGNTSGTVPVDSVSYLPGDSVTIKTNSGSLAKTGSCFQGWYTLDGSYYAAGRSLTMGNSDIILLANWGNRQSFTGYGNIAITADCIVTVKAGGASNEGSGGGGGYSYSVFTASAGDVLHVTAGTGGNNYSSVNTDMPALGGGTGIYLSGGGGSLVALYRTGIYTLKCCAGGGGGNNVTVTSGGAGGGYSGADGQVSSSSYYSHGGSNGTGGTGDCANGSNMSLTSATFKGLNGNGAASFDGTYTGTNGGGGGGYGGGSSTTHGSCGGGGGYCEGTGSATVAGSGITPGNSADPDLPAGYAVGGNGNNEGFGGIGGNGYVIVSIVYY